MEPNKYEIKEKVSSKSLLDAGFSKMGGSFVLSKPLFMSNGIPEIYMNLAVFEDENSKKNLTITVTRKNDEYFSSFYNPDERHHDSNYWVVVKNFNKYMDKLARKGIVTKITSTGKKEVVIEVKYLNDSIDELRFVGGKSDWVDLRAAETVTLKKGDFKLIPLGVAIKLPKGYEAIVAPRSSTFLKWGVLQTNGVGVIDETYCGDEDEWKFPAFATRDITIEENSRICQFRILRHQPSLEFIKTETLGNKSRGGFGSTGVS